MALIAWPHKIFIPDPLLSCIIMQVHRHYESNPPSLEGTPGLNHISCPQPPLTSMLCYFYPYAHASNAGMINTLYYGCPFLPQTSSYVSHWLNDTCINMISLLTPTRLWLGTQPETPLQPAAWLSVTVLNLIVKIGLLSSPYSYIATCHKFKLRGHYPGT